MADIVYLYKKSGDGGKELRHSLRSLKNLKGEHKVFIVGDTEPWVKNVTYIKTIPQRRSPYADTWQKLLTAMNSDEVSEEFIVMMDDVYITSPQAIRTLYDEELPERGAGVHKKGLQLTRELLLREHKTIRNYDIHVPFIVSKTRLREIVGTITQSMRGVSLAWRSYYGNHFDIGGEQYEDKKTRTTELLQGDIISTNYYTPELAQLFPEPSEYEEPTKEPDWTVSIVIPAYNAEENITRCLDSIPDHKFIKEIIVADDESSDSTLDILKNYERRTIKILENEKNMGVGYTFNTLIDANTSDYILRIDSDDYFTEKMVNVLDMINGEDIIYFNMTDNEGYRHDLDNVLKLKTVACCHIYKADLIGNTRCQPKNWGEDRDLFFQLVKKRPTELFTHIDAYHYNFPRKDSLTGIRMARRDGNFDVKEPRLNIFTNCHVGCTTEPTIFDTYDSYVNTFGVPEKLTIYCDPNPHQELYEEYSKQIEDYFKQSPIKTGGLAEGYKHSLDNADTEYLFQLEADWNFQNISHSVIDIVREQKRDMKIMMLFNQHQNIPIGWLRKYQTYFKRSKNPIYCSSDRVSNNPHIIEVEQYKREAMHLVEWKLPAAGRIEQELEKKFDIAIYGEYGLPPTIVHTDSRRGEKKLVW